MHGAFVLIVVVVVLVSTTTRAASVDNEAASSWSFSDRIKQMLTSARESVRESTREATRAAAPHLGRARLALSRYARKTKRFLVKTTGKNPFNWDISQTVDEFRVELEKKMAPDAERLDVWVVPSLSGSALYLRNKPTPKQRQKCHLNEAHDRVWLSTEIVVGRGAAVVSGKLLLSTRKCFGDLLTLDAHPSKTPDASWPVEYTVPRERELVVNFGSTRDMQYLASDLLSSVTDHADSLDVLITELRAMVGEGRLQTFQYDFRYPLGGEAGMPMRQLYTKMLHELRIAKRPIAVFAYSLGEVTWNEFVRFVVASGHAQLLKKIHVLNIVAGSDGGGSVDPLKSLINGTPNTDMVFGGEPVTYSMLRSWGVWPWILPSGKATGNKKWLRVKNGPLSGEYGTDEAPDVLRELFPGDKGMEQISTTYKHFLSHADEREAEIRAAYAAMSSAHVYCYRSTDVPTTTRITIDAKHIDRTAVDVALDGDGALPDSTLRACAHVFGPATGNPVHEMVQFMRPEDRATGGKPGGKGSLVHGAVGRSGPWTLKGVLATVAVLPDAVGDRFRRV